VTQTLTRAFHTAGARVVTGSFERIGAEHAGVPVAHAFTALGFVDDVETEAGWAEERAHSTAQTGARNFFPVGTGEVLIELLLKPLCLEGNGHTRFGSLLHLACLHILVFRRCFKLGEKVFAFFSQGFHQEDLTKVCENRVQTGVIERSRAYGSTETSFAGFVAAQADQNRGFTAGFPEWVGVAFLLKNRVEHGHGVRIAGTDSKNEAGGSF